MNRPESRSLVRWMAAILCGYLLLACAIAYFSGRAGVLGPIVAPILLLMVYVLLIFILLLVPIMVREFVAFGVTLLVGLVGFVAIVAFTDTLFLYGTKDRLVSRHLLPSLREWVMAQDEAQTEYRQNVPVGGRMRFYGKLPEFVAQAFGQGTNHAIFFVNDGGGRALESGGLGFSFGREPVRSKGALPLDDQTFLYRTLHTE